MNCRDILRMASQHVGPVPFLTEGRDWINMGLRDLGPALKLPATVTVTAEANAWIDTEPDFLKVFEVRDEAGRRYPWWEAQAARYRFGHDGTYTVHYYRSAKELELETDVPEGSPLFHDALVFFVCDQRQPGAGWSERYRNRVDEILDEVGRQSGRRIKARPWL